MYFPYNVSTSTNNAKVFASPYLTRLNIATQSQNQVPDLEKKIRSLEDERKTLQLRLAEAENERRRTNDLEKQGAQHLLSLQSSVLAMQQTMSQQASQLGGLQHMLGQQQRESQAWAQEVQDARARLRSMQQDHAGEISALRGTHNHSSLYNLIQELSLNHLHRTRPGGRARPRPLNEIDCSRENVVQSDDFSTSCNSDACPSQLLRITMLKIVR